MPSLLTFHGGTYDRRRSFSIAGATLLIVTAMAVAERATERVAGAATQPLAITPGGANRPVSFRDRLIVGLQARLPSEIAFIDTVVHLVHTGQVPQRMVDQTFSWARQRAAQPQHLRARRPIIYFSPAMTLRLRRLGIEIS